MSPALSIVIPVYDVDPFLGACLNSIAAQTFRDFECILVDDGSTDFGGIICDSWARKDSRFKVIHQENAGVSVARNVGIEAATAPLLAFIDPDDFVGVNYFELLIREIWRIDASVAASSVHLVQEDGTEGAFALANRLLQHETKNFPHEMANNKEVIDAVCKDVFGCNSWGKVFQRELWGTTRFPPIDLGEDVAVVPPTVIKASRAVYVPDAKYFYRQRKRSLLHGTVTEKRHRENIHASEAMLQGLAEHAPERTADFLMLKTCYDFEGTIAFLRSNPDVAQGKSKLYAALQAAGKLESWNMVLQSAGKLDAALQQLRIGK